MSKIKMRWFYVAFLALIPALAGAQEMNIPSWMLHSLSIKHFAPEKTHSDRALYSINGDDVMYANQFVGIWSGVLKLEIEGEMTPISFNGWSDTTRAMIQMSISGMEEVIYLVDLRANTAVAAVVRGNVRRAEVSSLHDVLTLNGMMRSVLLEEYALVPLDSSHVLDGVRCRVFTLKTMGISSTVLCDELGASPFRDMVNWAPIAEGPFMIMGLFGSLSEHAVRQIEDTRVVFHLTKLKEGRFKTPKVKFGKVQFNDRRKEPIHGLNIHSGPDPFWSEPRTSSYNPFPQTTVVEEIEMEEEYFDLEASPLFEEGISEVLESEGSTDGPGNGPVEELNTIYDFPEVMPQFPGGAAALELFMNQNLRFPEVMRDLQISGKVFVGFIVEKDGRISNIEVRRAINGAQELNDEAIRLVRSMPNWIPGRNRDQPVRVRFTLPVRFQL